jgi:hypothetical protein
MYYSFIFLFAAVTGISHPLFGEPTQYTSVDLVR